MALKPVYYAPHARRTRGFWEISPAEVLSALSRPDRTGSLGVYQQSFKRLGERHLRVTYIEEAERLLVLAVTPKLSPW